MLQQHNRPVRDVQVNALSSRLLHSLSVSMFLPSTVTDFPGGSASLKPQSVKCVDVKDGDVEGSRRLHVFTHSPTRSHGRTGGHMGRENSPH